MKEIKVLDHGYVRLVDSMGSDLSVVRSARVSYNADWRVGDDAGSDTRLINYLWRNRHTTPFESVTFTFEIKAPIFIFRQWHRHRTWSFNEISGRYTELTEEFYVPEPDKIGKQSIVNKQVRVLIEERDMLIPSMIDHACSAAFEAYRTLLAHEVPRELARSILPLATYSRMFATVNLLNLLKFINLRDHPHAQYEIQLYGKALASFVKEVCPTTYEAFDAHRNT